MFQILYEDVLRMPLAIYNSNNLPSRERVHIPPMGKANASSPTAFGWDVSLREG